MAFHYLLLRLFFVVPLRFRSSVPKPLHNKKNTMSQIEQDFARRAQMSLRVYRLQERLRALPIEPRDENLKQKRADLLRELVKAARKDRCISKITPWAASDF